MSGRKCGNCRHYEPSPIWRSGWCRNPRLYSPQESHLVRQEELGCAHRIGNYWEPAEDDEMDEPGGVKGVVGGLVKPLRLFGPGQRLIAATSGPPGGGRFGAGGGGRGGSGGTRGSGSLGSSGSSGSSGNRDAFGGGSGGTSGGGRPPAGGAGRPDRTGRLPGQERIVSYQPEERYWTDYLRIALPVVGLLLMLGLFWFWAANLINDEDDDEPPASIVAENVSPTATATVPAANPTQPPATTETVPAGAGPTETTPPDEDEEPTQPPDDEEEPTQPPENEEETEPPAEDDSRFPMGSTVIVNSDNVNFRPEPNTNNTPIRQLDNGEELTVVGPIETDPDGNEFLFVEDSSGTQGYVSTEFVQVA